MHQSSKVRVLYRFPAAIAAASIIPALGGCGDGLSKGSLAKVIEAQVMHSSRPVCWSVRQVPARLPLAVGMSEGPQADPILSGLGRAGLITFNMSRPAMGGAIWAIDLTDAGRKAQAWDPSKGFCVGRPRLDEVVRWTEPGQQQGAAYTQVTYRWKLGDRPDWAKPSMFPGVEGMAEPVEATVVLVKTSDGWRRPS